jgi:hypothetical protein
MRKALIIIIVLVCSILSAQAAEKQDVWEPLNFFVGSWTSEGKGCSGISTGEREYQFVLNGKFLQVKNKSIFEPQEQNPKGEVHEDWGFISHDGNRETFVWRQFHVEGFVNQYVLDSTATDGKTLVFVTESIENIPAGWRGRITCQILDDDEFTERFELAAPEKEFEVYVENHFKRSGSLKKSIED